MFKRPTLEEDDYFVEDIEDETSSNITQEPFDEYKAYSNGRLSLKQAISIVKKAAIDAYDARCTREIQHDLYYSESESVSSWSTVQHKNELAEKAFNRFDNVYWIFHNYYFDSSLDTKQIKVQAKKLLKVSSINEGNIDAYGIFIENWLNRLVITNTEEGLSDYESDDTVDWDAVKSQKSSTFSEGTQTPGKPDDVDEPSKKRSRTECEGQENQSELVFPIPKSSRPPLNMAYKKGHLFFVKPAILRWADRVDEENKSLTL